MLWSLRPKNPGALSCGPDALGGFPSWNPGTLFWAQDPRKKNMPWEILTKWLRRSPNPKTYFCRATDLPFVCPCTKQQGAQEFGQETIEPTKYRAAQKATLQWKTPMIMGHASTRRTFVEEKDPSCNKKARCHRKYSVATKSNNKILIQCFLEGRTETHTDCLHILESSAGHAHSHAAHQNPTCTMSSTEVVSAAKQLQDNVSKLTRSGVGVPFSSVTPNYIFQQ
jgi:hypothetical protein